MPLLPPRDVLVKNIALADKNMAVQDARRKVRDSYLSVTVTAKQKTKAQKMDERYTSGLFAGGDGYTFFTEDDISAQRGSDRILQYLQGRVAGLQITWKR